MHNWIDVALKILIAAAAAYGTYYLASQKQVMSKVTQLSYKKMMISN